MEMEQVKQEQKLDYEDFKGKLGGWGDLFKPFIEGPEMWQIYQTLKKDSRYETICPNSSQTFRAFECTKPEDVKVIFYLQDPYPRAYRDGKLQASGIAMDCSNSKEGKIQPSLEKWYEAMDKDLEKKVERSADLQYLHEQGVMLLNSDLTCKLNKTSSHEGLWEPFQKFFLEEILRSKKIIYVLCGKGSQKLSRYIQPFSSVIEVEHPAAAAHMHREWNHNGIFNQINKTLDENGQWDILWDPRDWTLYKEPPF